MSIDLNGPTRRPAEHPTLHKIFICLQQASNKDGKQRIYRMSMAYYDGANEWDSIWRRKARKRWFIRNHCKIWNFYFQMSLLGRLEKSFQKISLALVMTHGGEEVCFLCILSCASSEIIWMYDMQFIGTWDVAFPPFIDPQKVSIHLHFFYSRFGNFGKRNKYRLSSREYRPTRSANMLSMQFEKYF